MPKFRKKPVVIEAIQYIETEYESGFLKLREFVGNALVPYALTPHGTLGIETLEGLMKVSPGDWVIKGVNGEFYPCKKDIFEKTHELVEEYSLCRMCDTQHEESEPHFNWGE